MTNTAFKETVKRMGKLNDTQLLEMAMKAGITLPEAKALYTEARKEIKEEKARLAEARFSLEYGKSKFIQSAVYLTDKGRVIFKGLDKNSIVYAYENSGALCFKAISVVSSKSGKYELGKALSKGNESKVVKMLLAATSGMSYGQFMMFMRFRSNMTEREAKGIERSIPRA